MHQGAVALVLTDMMMPVMNGLAVIRAIREVNPAARIVAVSGVNDVEIVGSAAALGVHDFLPKPYDMASLLKLVRGALDRTAA